MSQSDISQKNTISYNHDILYNNCRNIHCKRHLSAHDMNILNMSKRPDQNRHKFCVRCRGRDSFDIECVVCGKFMSVDKVSKHKCDKCVYESRIIRGRRRNKNELLLHIRIKDFIIQNNPTKEEIIKEFNTTPISLKHQLLAIKKTSNLKKEIRYKIE